MAGRERWDIDGFSGHWWPQYPSEMACLAALFVKEGVRSYLEIGCRHGDSLHYLGMRLPVGARIVGVDIPDQRFPTAPADLKRAAADLRDHGRDVEIIHGDSHALRTAGLVHNIAHREGRFDAIFIDGDHSEYGVREDWRKYRQVGRLVAFHDLFGPHSGVRKVFSEIMEKGYKTQVIAQNRELRGIGIVWIGGELTS